MPHPGRHKADQTLLTVLACGATVENAARSAGVSASTAYRRLKDPEFRQKIKELQAETLQRAAAMLTAASMESVKTLIALQAANIPPAVRLGAARGVLEFGTKMRETVELEQRIAALERQRSLQA
jgi:hypothetical protein